MFAFGDFVGEEFFGGFGGFGAEAFGIGEDAAGAGGEADDGDLDGAAD